MLEKKRIKQKDIRRTLKKIFSVCLLVFCLHVKIPVFPFPHVNRSKLQTETLRCIGFHLVVSPSFCVAMTGDTGLDGVQPSGGQVTQLPLNLGG